jgi:glycerol uptake facilitator-like aquaporin
MEELIFFIVFTIWYAGALMVSDRLGKKSRLGEEWTFFLSFMLTPIVGAALALSVRSK